MVSNLCKQQEHYEKYRMDLRVVCSWVVTLPENVQAGDDRKFFQSVYDHLKKQYPPLCVCLLPLRRKITRAYALPFCAGVPRPQKGHLQGVRQWVGRPQSIDHIPPRPQQGSGLKLSAEMAQYIVRTGQKEQFAEYQRNNARQQGEERSWVNEQQ